MKNNDNQYSVRRPDGMTVSGLTRSQAVDMMAECEGHPVVQDAHGAAVVMFCFCEPGMGGD